MLLSFINENVWEWLPYKFVILTNVGVLARTHNELYLMGLSKKAVIKLFTQSFTCTTTNTHNHLNLTIIWYKFCKCPSINCLFFEISFQKEGYEKF